MKGRPRKPARPAGERAPRGRGASRVDASTGSARIAPLQGAGGPPKLIERRCVLESCGRKFTVDASTLSPSFPFCSARCKGVDLGMWVTEEYRVPAAPGFDEELDELDLGRRPTREADQDDDAQHDDAQHDDDA